MSCLFGFHCKKHQDKLKFTCEDCFEKWYFNFFYVYLKDIWCIFVILHVSKITWTWSNNIICLIFLFFTDVSKKKRKILDFFFLNELNKELKLYQILKHYHSSIKRYRLGSLSVWNHNFSKNSVKNKLASAKLTPTNEIKTLI